ncbi:MAG: succinylglutamate desuccinylase/aspartoacylase family protein [Saprospiraceae bacterium]|nr:succinylglutamate desuccinylase/aspartoacylase family protein [Saprospiraceae bacterium]
MSLSQMILPKLRSEIELIIDNEIIIPGKMQTIRINAGKLPSDNRINVVAHVLHTDKVGPSVLILGGVHGNEINGIEIVRRSIEEEIYSGLVCGTVIIIPLLNVYGFINFSRDVTDGKDVNRSFPGHLNGSLASRVARIMTKKYCHMWT